MKRLLICSIVVLAMTACGGNGSGKKGAQEQATVETEQTTAVIGQRIMPRVVVPAAESITMDKYRKYLSDHYWDNFDFGAGDSVAAYDTVEMCRAFADYVATCVDPDNADTLMTRLMNRASASRPVLDYFAMLAERVLHDPNSPMRNDEYYIPVLQVLVSSPLYDIYDRIAPEYDLHMALQNRPGHDANDFVYTLASGRSSRMHDIEAGYLLIFINNPGCPMCRQITEAITASPMLNELTERGTLRVLAIYPDADLDAWRDYAPNMPSAWINAYDKEQTISSERLYDLKAIPAMYLLDCQKRVMIKDGTSVEQVEYAIIDNEARN
ncbi:MAG: DUF5106 domain-containing protein [Alistipes sp.]|nr:DUF5106 domain-containing protein [Alistipes sp.]